MLKKIFAITIILASVLGSSAFAQDRKIEKSNYRIDKNLVREDARKVKACHEIEKLDRQAHKFDPLKGIELTPEQKAKVDKMKQKASKERDKVRERVAKERDKAKQRHAKEIKKQDKEMQKILTPEQYEQYKANKKAFRQDKSQEKRHHKGLQAGRHGKHGKHNKDCRFDDCKGNRAKCEKRSDCNSKPAPGVNCNTSACTKK